MSRYEYERTYTVTIDAPVHTVFVHCSDPRNLFAGHPKITVSDATLTDEIVGSIVHVRNRTMPITEYVTHEVVTVVPDERIVLLTRLKMLDREWRERVTWTWDFSPEGDGTRITVDFHQTEVPWLQHLIEGLGEKSWDGTVNGWLAHIKAEVERESAGAT